jgi:NAD+ synthase (glutamine-hydrolysing)
MIQSLRIRCEQLNPRLGDLQHNLELHRQAIAAARTDGIELLVFPELSLTGYFLKDQTAELALTLESPELQTLAGESGDLSILVGFVERADNGALYNSAAWLERGEVRHVHRKVHLVSYGMFDEGRDFAAGPRFRAFDTRFGRFGILICEDAWHVPGPYLYLLDDVDGIVVPSASPARGVAAADEPGLRSRAIWFNLLSNWALLTQSWVVYSNRAGFEDGVAFGGGSSVFGPDGRCTANLEGLDPGQLDVRLEGSELERARLTTPLRRDERPWILAAELGERNVEGRHE